MARRLSMTDVSPKVQTLIDESKKKDADERKRNRLKRAIMVPILLTQVAPLATDVIHATQPFLHDLFEGSRRNK